MFGSIFLNMEQRDTHKALSWILHQSVDAWTFVCTNHIPMLRPFCIWKILQQFVKLSCSLFDSSSFMALTISSIFSLFEYKL